MKVQKLVRAQGEFAKKGVDISAGDIVTIKNEGEWISGQFGDQFVVRVETKNGEKNVNFNQTTINILHDEFGDDTKLWVGKNVVVRVKKDTVANRKVDIYYFVTPNWDFDEYRELVNTKKAEPEIPVINTDEEPPTPTSEDLPF